MRHIIAKYFKPSAARILLGAVLTMSASTALAVNDGRTIHGKIVDADGKPVTGAIVNINECLIDVDDGTRNRPSKFVTEATSVVTGSELEKHPVTVLQNAFTSTLTGVETYESQSEPGWSETDMYIRGIRTMNSSARSP